MPVSPQKLDHTCQFISGLLPSCSPTPQMPVERSHPVHQAAPGNNPTQFVCTVRHARAESSNPAHHAPQELATNTHPDADHTTLSPSFATGRQTHKSVQEKLLRISNDPGEDYTPYMNTSTFSLGRVSHSIRPHRRT